MSNSTLLIEKFPEQINQSFNTGNYQNQFHDCSFIVNASGKDVDYPSHWGLLSIKSAFGGAEIYESKNSVYAVTDKNYLLYNEGTHRASHIHSDNAVHSFSITFSPKLVSSFYGSYLKNADHQLNNPFDTNRHSIDFTEKLYPHDLGVSPILFTILNLCQNWEQHKPRIEELLSDLLTAMAENQKEVWNSMTSVKALKSSTQKELYLRIHRAKDYISSCYSENLTIQSLAEVACLNQHYFLREFKKIITTTPHQYLQKVRLAEAGRLLINTENSVGEVCNAVGFNDIASFCKLFKRNFLLTPSDFRKKSYKLSS